MKYLTELFSQPDKWKPRRKLLTPTFHYDILKDFVEVTIDVLLYLPYFL